MMILLNMLIIIQHDNDDNDNTDNNNSNNDNTTSSSNNSNDNNSINTNNNNNNNDDNDDNHIDINTIITITINSTLTWQSAIFRELSCHTPAMAIPKRHEDFYGPLFRAPLIIIFYVMLLYSQIQRNADITKAKYMQSLQRGGQVPIKLCARSAGAGSGAIGGARGDFFFAGIDGIKFRRHSRRRWRKSKRLNDLELLLVSK